MSAYRSSRRYSCACCPSRHQGVCDGISAHDAADVAALEAARSVVRVYEADDIIYVQGDPTTHVFKLISGWVELHCDLADGRRQITKFLQPGALFGFEPAGEDCGQTATAITPVVVCPIETRKFHDLRRSIPTLNEQFVALLLREHQNVSRALASIGQLSAKERVAMLLWDLAVTDGAGASSFPSVTPMPLTQRHLAEATGLTSIHINRVLRRLREEHVLELRQGRLHILSPDKLRFVVGLGIGRVQASEPAVSERLSG